MRQLICPDLKLFNYVQLKEFILSARIVFVCMALQFYYYALISNIKPVSHIRVLVFRIRHLLKPHPNFKLVIIKKLMLHNKDAIRHGSHGSSLLE